jgi:hypothetical protein
MPASSMPATAIGRTSPDPRGLQGAEILVLDAPVARWRVDHVFDEQLPDGCRRDLAVSALDEVSFGTDGKGALLPAPVAMLTPRTGT